MHPPPDMIVSASPKALGRVCRLSITRGPLMHRSRLLPYAIVLLSVFLDVPSLGAETNLSAAQASSVSIEDFGYLDTSGEPVDQTADHQKRLQGFMSALKRDVEAAPGYRLVPSAQTDASFGIV